MRQTAWLRASVLVLVLVLASSPVFAGNRSVRPTAPEVPGVFAMLWQAVSRLLPAFGQSGPEVDPKGPGTATTPPAPEDPASDSDRGPGVDPWG
jgi:hypothetical protein